MRPRPKPNARWECGYRAVGNECEEGPTEKGICCQRNQSADSDSVSCDVDCGCAATCKLAGLRRQPSLPSHKQLGPCVPRRTDWFARQSIALNAAVLTGGILLLCMSLSVREQVFVPGGLSSKHSQILGNRLVSERCSQCHTQVHGTLIESLMGDSVGRVQDEKCMTCHDSHMPDAGRRSPHDLTGDEIRLISSAINTTGQVNWRQLSGRELSGDTKTHCASCHVEHHGSDHRIAAMADARCQACHQDQFASLTNGHPEFDGFPYRTQRSIKFDHNTHAQKHFSSKSQSFECRACHIQSKGKTDGVFRTLGFEDACASCHAEPIRAAAVGGWAILQLPSLETETAVANFPFWPEEALYGFDGQVTPVMQALLSTDAALGPMLDKLPEDRQLANVENNELRSMVSVATASGVREIILGVADGGQVAWRKRLVDLAERKLARKLNIDELRIVDEMTNGLPPDLFQEMAQRWLQPARQIAKKPNAVDGRLVSQSDDDLLLGSDGGEEALLGTLEDKSEDLVVEPIELPRIKGAKHVSIGGWYLDEQLFTLRYMPRGHGDLTLAAWAQFLHMLKGDERAAATFRDAMLDNCIECHKLGGSEIGLWADWKSKPRPAKVRPFTKFDHTPHLTLPVVNDCKYCHQLEAAKVALDSTSAALSSVALSLGHGLDDDFVPMKIEQCSACHRKGGAKDGCTTCHNYHVGTAGLQWSRSPGQ